MKKIIALAMCAGMLFSSCSDFLDRYPKGRWHSENMPETDLDMSILAQAKLMEALFGRLWLCTTIRLLTATRVVLLPMVALT